MSYQEGFKLFVKEAVQTVAITLVVLFFVYNFLVQPHRVKGDSMLPNYHDGELLLTEKISYRFGDPHRGDVIVFRAPVGRKVDFIKRIVGLPDDTVSIQDGKVLINGSELKEPYETQLTQGNDTVQLSDNQYFVLGDNRNSSSDSRSFGLIDKESIRGRVWVVYWPPTGDGGFRTISRVNY
ncbi:MAG: signal peptidase I [Candidatus Curtissbacteria bacterium]|nr:signal peptidase I [Candidatus Curtissbacteria bacterium]